MVLVTMGQENTTDFALVLLQIGHIGNHQIDSIHVVFREAQTAVHHDDVISIFQHRDILADLIEAAQ